MQDKKGNEINIESKVYVDGSYGIVLEIKPKTNELSVKINRNTEHPFDSEDIDLYDTNDVLIIKESIYTNLEAIDKSIAEAETDISWSDDDNTIDILKEKIDNLEQEKKEILVKLEGEYTNE